MWHFALMCIWAVSVDFLFVQNVPAFQRIQGACRNIPPSMEAIVGYFIADVVYCHSIWNNYV